MNININVKRKFKINGKEYNSIEEMPDDIREIFKKTSVSQTGLGHEICRTTRTKIIFNGTEYDNVDAIPQDVRQLYENVLKGAEAGAAPTGIDITGISSRMMTGPVTPGNSLGDNRKTTKIETSFSLRTLIVSIMAAALILLLYYLVKSR